MKLYEFEQETVDATILTGIVGQYFNRIKDTGYKQNKIDLDVILGTLNDRGLNLDKELFLKMIQHPPLSNIIKDVDQDQVVFKSSEDELGDESDTDDQVNLLDKMAKSALPK